MQDLVLEQVLAAQALIMTELNLKSTNVEHKTAKKQVESQALTTKKADIEDIEHKMTKKQGMVRRLRAPQHLRWLA